MTRWERWTYRWVRRHPRHRELELELIIARNGVELFEREVYEANQAALCAHDAAQAMYNHVQEVVGVIRWYQDYFVRRHFPDPQEARVQVVVDNFFEQFKDEYDSHDG